MKTQDERKWLIIPVDLHTALKLEAVKRGITLRSLAIQFLQEKLHQEKSEQEKTIAP